MKSSNIFKGLMSVIDLTVISSIVIFTPFDLLLAIVVILYLSLPIANFFLRKKRVSKYYTVSTKTQNDKECFLLHLSVALWLNKNSVLASRTEAIQELKKKGDIELICGDTMTFHQINEGLAFEELSKWSKYGILVMFTTIIAAILNLRKLFKLSLTRKIYNIIFVLPLRRYYY